MKMNEAELVAKIAELTEQPRPLVKLIIHALAHVTSEALAHGNAVKLPRLGILATREIAPKAGVFRGKSGEAIEWSRHASRKIAFRPETGLKAAIATQPNEAPHE